MPLMSWTILNLDGQRYYYALKDMSLLSTFENVPSIHQSCSVDRGVHITLNIAHRAIPIRGT